MKIRRFTVAIILCAVLIVSNILLGIRTYAYDVEEFTALGVVNTASTELNIRSGPGTAYEVVTQLPKGTLIDISGKTTDVNDAVWYKIYANGYTGFAMGKYIKVVEIPDTPDEAFELSISRFPESYKEKLRILHALNPTWKFTALETNITWETLMYNECKLGRNLLQAPDAWKSFKDGAYDWVNKDWYSFDSGGWEQACDEVIAYYLDPRNFLDPAYIYQFLVLSYDGSEIKEEVINEILKGSFAYNATCPGGDEEGKELTYAQGLIKAGVAAGASPYMLAARIKQEQGKGNKLAFGTVTGYEGYFNHFNIGAYAHSGNSAILNGAIRAKNKGWDTAYKSLLGGAQFLVNSYVGVGQNTLYLQKFDVVDGGNGLYSHQYMTNVQAPAGEYNTLKNAIESAGADKGELNFLIPVYLEMPEELPTLPLREGNANYYLASLSVTGKDIEFDKYKLTYELLTDQAQIEIKAEALDKGAKVEGTGKIDLTEGVNEIKVTVTASNGLKQDYKIFVSTTADRGFLTEFEEKGEVLTGITHGMTAPSFKEKLTVVGYTLLLTDKDGNEKADTSIMMTGDKVKLMFEEKEEKVYEVAVKGDSTGDGKINSRDLLRTQKAILGISPFESDVYKAASDYTGDGVVNSRDLLACQKKILGLI